MPVEQRRTVRLYGETQGRGFLLLDIQLMLPLLESGFVVT